MTYQESVQFLYALGNEMKTAKLGLDRILALLAELGDPQAAYRIVHVAGTNGKGSTCAMIEAGLRAAGRHTGLFISPHLQEPTERIQVDGIAVSPQEFERAFEIVHAAANKLNPNEHPTYFETVTAMALWVFRARGVEIAVLETGLGGRLDATNVVHPVLTVITAVDYDHQNFLGESLREIAGEKAGILKPDVPAIFARQHPEAQKVLDQKAQDLGVPVYRTAEFPPQDVELSDRGSRFRLFDPAVWIECPLAGEHQIENAVTAAVALRALGVPAEGISEARWPGRLEHVAPNPDTILDGAHNPAGAQALARYLQHFYSHRRIWMIFAAMREKAVGQVGSILFPLADELIFTAPEYYRAVPPEELRELAGRGQAIGKVADAIEYAQSHASAEDVIVITGSLYLVGEARAKLSRHSQGWPALIDIPADFLK